MGLATSSEAFTPSVTFITTDTKHEDPPRVPIIGNHAGCLFGRSPGASVRALEAELRDLKGAQTSKGTSRLAISKRVSATGVLRTRRVIV